MKKQINVFLVLSLATPLFFAACNSGDKKLKPGEKAEIKIDDKVVGVREQITETEQRFKYDQDNNKVFEKTVIKNGETITEVMYDDDQNGHPNKTVIFDPANGKRVVTYDPATNEKKAETFYDKANKVKYTELVMVRNNKKYKKRVHFKADGTVDDSKIETLLEEDLMKKDEMKK